MSNLLSYFELSRKRHNSPVREVDTSDECVSTQPLMKKKRRPFQQKWLHEYSWLRYDDGTMFCAICRQEPVADKSSTLVIGVTGEFRRETLKFHDASRSHQRAVGAQNATLNPEDTPFSRSIRGMKTGSLTKMSVLFEAVYLVTKREQSLRLYPDVCTVLKKTGTTVGHTYVNDKAARVFAGYIAEEIRCNTVSMVEKSDFISILADGSTDRAVVESEVVYVNIVKDGTVKSCFVGMAELDSGDAAGVLSAIDIAIEKSLHFTPDQWRKKLVGFGSDGASVMRGSQGGVTALLKADVPHLIAVHCVAHRLELSILDVIKDVPYVEKFESVVKKVYEFYSRSPKRTKGLKEIADIMEDESVVKFTGILAVRWVSSKLRAVKALLNNWKCTILHLDEVSHSTKRDDAAKATGLLTKLKQYRFVYFLHFMVDFLEEVSKLSVKFQRETSTFNDVQTSLEYLIITLTSLKESPGANVKKFKQLLQGDKFKDIEVITTSTSSRSSQPQEDGEAFCQKITTEILDHTSQYISHRFCEFLDDKCASIVAAFAIINPHLWPTDHKHLVEFGNEDLVRIIAYFQSPLKSTDFSEHDAKKEWIQFKLESSRYHRGLDVHELWKLAFTQQQSRYNNLLKVVNILLVLPMSTAVCERGFSCLNRIKSDQRTRLVERTIEDLMRISINGPSIEEFDPIPAIEIWWKDTTRTRRPDFKRKPKDKSTPLSSFDSTLSESTENQEPSIIDSSYSEDDFSKDFD